MDEYPQNDAYREEENRLRRDASEKIARLRQRIAELERENAEMRKDKERLDYLIRSGGWVGGAEPDWGVMDCEGLNILGEGKSPIMAIDDAMAKKRR